MITRAIFSPHPPVLVPSIGQAATKKVATTVETLKKINQKLVTEQPETIVLISPHGPHSSEGVPILVAPSLEGNFGNHGDPETILAFNNDPYLIPIIDEELSKVGIKTSQINDPFLDHGSMVPLYFLSAGLPDVNLIPLGYYESDRATHYKIGQTLGRTLAESDEKTIFIASGDLSHRLSEESQDGYSPRAEEFDQKIAEIIKRQDAQALLDIEEDLVVEAGQCGLNSATTLLGLLENFKATPEDFHYEAPFGVGYLTADFKLSPKSN
jgi:aromatic ring-opening dioxygenase LigB subunit